MIRFFDGHNDFLLRLMMSPQPREQSWLAENEAGHMDLPRLKKSGFAGGLFAIFVPPESDDPPPDFEKLTAQTPYEFPMPPMSHDAAQPVALAMAGLLNWMERAAPDDFAVCRSVGDIRAAWQADRIAGVMHMEGAEAIGPDLDALYLFHQIGPRSLGPVWSRTTIFGHGVPISYPGTPDIGEGLSEKGKDLVRLCNELKILIDLSHLNEAGFDDVAAVSDAPLVATHSNAHRHCESPRNLTDRQLARIKETNGLVGLNFSTSYLNQDGTSNRDVGWDTILRHLDHLIEHVGEANVGLGSDFDGCVLPREIGDVCGVPRLFEAMSKHGYDDNLISRIAKDSWLGCLERTLGG